MLTHNDCNCFKVTFLEKAMILICFNNSCTSLSGICTHISIVSKVRPKYSIFVIGPQEHGSQNLDHYLDAFFFAGESNTDNCKRLMKTFDHVCERLGVPIAKEKIKVSWVNR
jgi:hypothetical protein